VTWAVQEGPGCGTIGPDGTYVAPAATASGSRAPRPAPHSMRTSTFPWCRPPPLP
jgi:hypothetical protein